MSRAPSFSKSAPRLPQGASEPKIAYVRPFWADEQTPPGVQPKDLYALHGADGARLGVFTDRDMAFAVARRNNLTPVNAH